MPDFTDPFRSNVPDRKLTDEELIRAIRMDVAAELDAASLYEAHAQATDNPLARKVLLDVANEERVHVGEFMQLIKLLAQDEEAWLQNGYNEVNEMAEEVAMGDLEVATPAEKAAEEGLDGDRDSGNHAGASPTIGSMRE